MSTEVTGQLRAGIDRVPAQVPPGLARRAYHRYRRRRLAARAIVAAGTVAVAAVAAAVFLPGPAEPATQDAAYVVSHVTQALDALPADTIFFDRMTHGDGYRMDNWRTEYRSRWEVFNPSGQVVAESGRLVTATRYQVVTVDYQHKYWWRLVNSNGYGRIPRPGPLSQFTCDQDGPSIVGMTNPRQFAAWLHAEVSCRQLTVGGTAIVDGVSAVKLTSKNTGNATLTYWLNPTTYLPVRVTVTGPPGLLSQDDLQWLPPTAANLAKVSLPVPPAGFTQVPANGCIAAGTCKP